jgi:hypothetical protein
MEEPTGTGTLQFRITYRTSDLYAATLAMVIRIPVLWLMVAGCPCVLSYFVPWPVGVLATMLFYPLLFYFLARAGMKQLGTPPEISCGFSPEGFTITSRLAATTCAWAMVKRVRETRKFILIELSGRVQHVIPLRQITGEQADQLRSLLRTHVTKNVKLAKR